MRKRYIRDIKIGIIGGLIGFFLIYIPIWKLLNLWIDTWEKTQDETISVYVEGNIYGEFREIEDLFQSEFRDD